MLLQNNDSQFALRAIPDYEPLSLCLITVIKVHSDWGFRKGNAKWFYCFPHPFTSVRAWVGKFFRHKAVFLPFVPLKAAVKVNLPISTLYVAWLWTTVIWPSKSVCVWKLHSKILWLVRTRSINTVQGNYDHPECRDCSGGSCSLLKKGATQKSKVIS